MPKKSLRENSEFLESLKRDYPNLVFRDGKRFSFRPPMTILVGPAEENWEMMLLHEVGHAVSLHRDFDTDARRLKMEREAWEKARELAPKYEVDFRDDVVEQALDSYREWLHKKSVCPRCGLVRFETPDGVYHCPKCDYLA